MGHPTDIFSSEPPSSCVCAICHDILEDASSLKECGHTFCDVCMKDCLEHNPSCPNCRVAVTGSNPNYPLREIIETMQVSCPEWTDEDDDESGNKRKRGCDWEGTIEGLKVHENVCKFKVIACNVDGCGYTCKRKDMESHHSSTMGIMMHMECRHGNKMRGMELRHKNEMKALQLRCETMIKAQDQKYDRKLKKKMKELESTIHTKLDAKERSSLNDAVISLNDAVIQCVKTEGAQSDSGVHINQIIDQVLLSCSQRFSTYEIKNAIVNLSNEGHIYSTIDEYNYQYAL